MIRINLIAGERHDAKPVSRALQIGQKVTLAGSLILLVAVLLLGWRYWATSQTEAQIAADIDVARAEQVRLAEVLKQIADFESQGTQLQQRVALIDELRRGQTAPVHLIDQISRSLPDLTWLTSLKQDGYEVTIEGHCTSLDRLSDFVGNLEAKHYFRRPVEIVMSEVVSGQDSAPDLIRFTIKGSFQMAGIEQPPVPRAPAAGGNGG